MVEKIIACADIHFKSLMGIEDLKKTLTEFIGQAKEIVSMEESPENVRIVVAGDIFDNKISITSESILAVHWFLTELGKICKTIVIIGNHDFLMNNTDRVDSLTPLFEIGNIQNVVYLDKELNYDSGCFVDDNIVWCLYSSFSGFNTPSIKEYRERFKSDKKSFIGLIHGDINGATTHTARVTENGLSCGIFEDCDFVIAGHVHKRQELKQNGVRIVYCSSIKQKSYDESISGHGFVLWSFDPDINKWNYKFVDVKDKEGGYFKFEINNIEDINNNKEELINL